MKKATYGLVVALIALFIFTGCETDKATLLTDGVWNFHNLTSDSEDPDTQQLMALFKALMTDATLEFKSDDTYILTSPLMEEPEIGTWSLVGEDQLIMDPDDDVSTPANIDKLSKDELIFIETYVDAEMNSYSVTLSWKR